MSTLNRTNKSRTWLTTDDSIWSKTIMIVSIHLQHLFKGIEHGYWSKYKSHKTQKGLSSETKLNELTHNDSEWKWTGFPRMWESIIYYELVSLILFLYCLIKYTAPQIVYFLLDFIIAEYHIPHHCYLLGRFVCNNRVNQESRIFITALQLAWRAWQFRRPHNLSALYFLLTDPDDHHRYYRALNLQESNLRAFAECHGQQFPSSADITHQQKREDDSSDQELSENFYPTSDLKGNAHKSDQFFHDFMAYKVIMRDRVIYRIRPNRTQEAYKILTRFVKLVILVTASGFVINSLYICWLFIQNIYYDEGYVLNYPGCSPELELKLAKDRNHSKTTTQSTTWTAHRVVVFPFDLVENLILWFETLINFAFGIQIGLILNYDLLLYWRHLHKKIKQIKYQAEGDYYESLEHQFQVTGSDRYGSTRVQSYAQRTKRRDLSYLIDTSNKRNEEQSFRFRGNRRTHLSSSSVGTRDFERLELNSQIGDFFQQIQRVDTLISDGIACTLGTWFVLFPVIIYRSQIESQLSSQDSNMVYVVLSLTTALFVSIFSTVLTLHRQCMKTYIVLCSLIAHDCHKTKESSLAILDYFISKKTCYTIFGTFRIVPTTCISLVGWSFSCFFVITGLLRRH